MLADPLRAITFKSTAGNVKRLVLNISLTKRLTLLRVTAQPTFLLTVTPRRACGILFACQTTRITLEEYFWTESFNLRNSDRFRNLAVEGYELLAGSVPLANGLLCCNAHGQVFSTFCSSALDYKAAILAGHSHQETVGSFT